MDATPHQPSEDETLGDSEGHPAPLSTGLQVVLVLMALCLLMLVAGIPGLEPVAGNGSRELRRDWAERHAATAALPASAPIEGAPLPASVAPADASVDRDDANR